MLMNKMTQLAITSRMSKKNQSLRMFKLADLKEIPLGKSKVATLPDGSEIALFNVGGKIYALDNSCPHMGGPLGEGEIDDCIVTCPWHGWQFNVADGACINMPGEDATSLPIEIKDEAIFLRDLE
jgi:nitrite reductase (NADH) small subunit